MSTGRLLDVGTDTQQLQRCGRLRNCSEMSNTAGCMLAAACTAHAAAATDSTAGWAATLLEKMSRLALACAASTFAALAESAANAA